MEILVMSFDELFPESNLPYQLDRFYRELQNYFKNWIENIDIVCSPKNKAFVRGILSNSDYQELATMLGHASGGALRKYVCDNLAPWFRNFFNLEKFQWRDLGKILENNGYRKLSYAELLASISKPLDIELLNQIKEIQKDRIEYILGTISREPLETRKELMQQGRTLIYDSDSSISEAMALFRKSINGNIDDKFGRDLLVEIALLLNDLEYYDICDLLIDSFKDCIDEHEQLGELINCRASYVEEISFKFYDKSYWQKARCFYLESHTVYKKNIYCSWNVVRLTIEFGSKIEPNEQNEYELIARADWHQYTKVCLEHIQSIPTSIERSMRKTLEMIKNETFRQEIESILISFNQI